MRPRRICEIYDLFAPHIDVLTYLLTYLLTYFVNLTTRTATRTSATTTTTTLIAVGDSLSDPKITLASNSHMKLTSTTVCPVSHYAEQGRNFVSKSGGTNFRFVWKFGAKAPRGWSAGWGFLLPSGEVSGEEAVPLPRKFF